MEDVNVVVVSGRATRDAELKFTSTGTAVANLSIAVNRTKVAADGTRTDEVSYLDARAWAKNAEVIGQYVKKGKAVTIEGSLKQDRWQSKDGESRSKIVLEIARCHFGADARKAEREGSEPTANGPEGGDGIPF